MKDLKNPPIKIFGHKVPDTDTVVSAIAYAWYYTVVKEQPAEAYILGDLNKETEYVLNRFGFDTPKKLGKLNESDQVVIVDTNNVHELPEDLGGADLIEIIDHHMLTGSLNTPHPIAVTLRPMASTASLIYTVLNPELHNVEITKEIAGIMLAGILSDTLEFRSPTTTEEDKLIANELAKIAGVDISEMANAMFEAKSDVSDLSASDLLEMDSKEFEIKDKKIRISVAETTNPEQILKMKDEIVSEMKNYVEKNDVDEILFFTINILEEYATPIVASENACEIIEEAFNIKLDGEVNIPGVVSRKKQIIPALKS